jgi:opacity protein-like surface antigen
VDLKPGPQVYVGAGFVRSLGDRFALGARARAQAARLRSEVNACDDDPCTDPDGLLRAATVEGRLLFTSPDWISPYLLVGLGVVNVTVDPVTVSRTGTTYEKISVTDAGGDVGLGASFLVVGGLFVDVEMRVTGTLPGGKENAVTALPFTLGVAYQFN